MIEKLKEKFESVYREFYSERDRDGLKVPKVTIALIEPTLNRFLQGLITPGIHQVFYIEKRWNLSMWFMGELCSDLRERGYNGDKWITYDRKTNQVIVNKEVFFCLMIILKREAVKKLVKVRGLPEWMDQERFDKCCRDVDCILKKDSNVKSILRGRSVQCKFFKTQKDVVDYLKGRVKDEKILEVIDICAKRSPGWSRSKGFRNLKEFYESFEVYKFDMVKEYGAENLKKKKITDGVMKKYLLYLGLMSTIQSREERPIEINTHTEQIIFNFYPLLRKIAMRKKYMDVFDSTFCPGVRSRSFLVNILCKAPVIAAKTIFLNRIEEKYMRMSDVERVEYAQSIGYQAIPYLKARYELWCRQEALEYHRSVVKKKRFVVHKYGKEHGKAFVRQQYVSINASLAKKSQYEDHFWMIFQVKFSNSRAYMWADRPGRAVA